MRQVLDADGALPVTTGRSIHENITDDCIHDLVRAAECRSRSTCIVAYPTGTAPAPTCTLSVPTYRWRWRYQRLCRARPAVSSMSYSNVACESLAVPRILYRLYLPRQYPEHRDSHLRLSPSAAALKFCACALRAPPCAGALCAAARPMPCLVALCAGGHISARALLLLGEQGAHRRARRPQGGRLEGWPV